MKRIVSVVILLLLVSVLFLCSFGTKNSKNYVLEHPIVISEDILQTYDSADDVFVGKVTELGFLSDTTIRVVSARIISVHKGDNVPGQTVKYLYRESIISDLGIKENDLCFFMNCKESSYYKIIRVKKDKSLVTLCDRIMYSEDGTMNKTYIENSPPSGYDSLMRTISKNSYATVNPYLYGLIIGLVVSVVCFSWRCKIFVDNVIAFIINFLVLSVYALGTETAGFYFYTEYIELMNVINNTIEPLITVTVIHVILSLSARIVLWYIRRKKQSDMINNTESKAVILDDKE